MIFYCSKHVHCQIKQILCFKTAKCFNLSDVKNGASWEQGDLKKHPLCASWEQHGLMLYQHAKHHLSPSIHYGQNM